MKILICLNSLLGQKNDELRSQIETLQGIFPRGGAE